MQNTNRKRIGVIGLGQWGPNHVRTFSFHPRAELVRMCDKSGERLKAVGSLFPHVEGVSDPARITHAEDIDAVVVATPVATHYDLVKDALLSGKDVFCEKPLTSQTAQSEELVRLAAEKGRILMTGYVFLFNAGILKLKEIIRSPDWGKTYYLHATRTNLGPVRTDVNSVFDLASHDISICNFLFEAEPKVTDAVGCCYLQQGVEDVAFVSLEYPGGVMAHLHVSWLDPKKVREITVVGKNKMAIWSDLRQEGPIEIFTKHIEAVPYYKDYGEFHLLVKEGESVTPHVKAVEPLKTEVDHFIECLWERHAPRADGPVAVQVARTLEAIEAILSKKRRAS